MRGLICVSSFNYNWKLHLMMFGLLEVASYHFKVLCANDIAPIMPRKLVYCYQIEVFVVVQHGDDRLIKKHVTYFIAHGT